MTDETTNGFEQLRPQLERLAVSVYIDLMSDSTIDPKVRKDAADSVMKALGKDAPVKANSPGQIIMNFQGGLKSALSGASKLAELASRSAPEQETTIDADEPRNLHCNPTASNL